MHRLSKGEWVIVVNNHPHVHYVYAFSFLIKVFQKLQGLSYWEYNHAARVVDGVVIEMVATGRMETPLSEWMGRGRRTVAVLKPNVSFVDVPPMPYGYFDIPQIVLHKLRKRLGVGHSWNGKSGVRIDGLFCSEEVAAALSIPNPHTVVPADLFHCEELHYVGEFETYPLQ